MTLKEIAFVGVLILGLGVYWIGRLIIAAGDAIVAKLDTVITAIEVLHDDVPGEPEDGRMEKTARILFYYSEKERKDREALKR